MLDRYFCSLFFIEGTQKLTERENRTRLCRYRGHDASRPRRVFIAGHERGVFRAVKRGPRRRSAIEPVIDEGRETPRSRLFRSLRR